MKKKRLCSTDLFFFFFYLFITFLKLFQERFETDELFKELTAKKRKRQISPGLRSLALTLHFYSPRAYEYVRQTFHKLLPNQSIIRKWYQGYDCSPGFSTEALMSLQMMSNKAKSKNEKLYGSLIMEEMKIREQQVYDKSSKCNVGFEDYGDVKAARPKQLPNGEKREAREALVFMINIVDRRCKIPVAYFLTAGMTGEEKANLVK